jgi:EpsI family protein
MLAAQAALFYLLPGVRSVPLAVPLSQFPAEIGSWRLLQEGVVDAEVREVLRADDLLNRTYARSEDGIPVNLFLAYFESQAEGQAPHSPRNCLPGAGWAATEAGVIEIRLEDGSAPATVNRYIVSRAAQRALVLYWYQSRHRVVANEYAAKFYLVADTVTQGRTETTLVRIVTPLLEGGADRAEKAALEFAASVYRVLGTYLPD